MNRNLVRALVSAVAAAAMISLLSGAPATAAPTAGPQQVLVVNSASAPIPTVQAGPFTVDIAGSAVLPVKPPLGAPFSDTCYVFAALIPGTPSFSGRCTFSRFPSGKRLVIEHVSGEAKTAGANADLIFTVYPQIIALQPPNLYAAHVLAPTRVTPTHVIVSQPFNLHLDPEGNAAGDRFFVGVEGEDASGPPPFVRITITGRIFDR